MLHQKQLSPSHRNLTIFRNLLVIIIFLRHSEPTSARYEPLSCWCKSSMLPKLHNRLTTTSLSTCSDICITKIHNQNNIYYTKHLQHYLCVLIYIHIYDTIIHNITVVYITWYKQQEGEWATNESPLVCRKHQGSKD